MEVGAVQRRWTEVAGRRVSLHVMELGLACCGLEVREARRAAAVVDGLPGTSCQDVDDDQPPELHVLVVAGTVTARLAPLLAVAHEGLPEPRAVLAFGACAATGGPYWDSYSVLPGAQQVVPVDVWVPGCPPRPADLQAGLEEVVHGRP